MQPHGPLPDKHKVQGEGQVKDLRDFHGHLPDIGNFFSHLSFGVGPHNPPGGFHAPGVPVHILLELPQDTDKGAKDVCICHRHGLFCHHQGQYSREVAGTMMLDLGFT